MLVFLLLVTILAITACSVQGLNPNLVAPFPVVYPHELTTTDRLSDFFQFSHAEMAYVRVFYNNTNGRDTYPVGSTSNSLLINSIIYRTSPSKGVLFHFEPDSLGCFKLINDILEVVDHSTNVYKLPAVVGPQATGESVHFKDVLKYLPQTAKIAFGFMEDNQGPRYKHDLPPPGYSREDIDALSLSTRSLCEPLGSKYYIALNAYYLGEAHDFRAINFYWAFRNCRLLLYMLPNLPAVNVRKVREVLLDAMSLNRSLILVPGHSLQFRLLSLHCVPWGYVKGHDWNPNGLGKDGLMNILNMGASTIRLTVHMIIQRKKLPPTFTFRKMSESDIRRLNFKVDVVQFLAQVIDHSHIVLLYLAKYDQMTSLMSFFSPKYLPFLEIRIFQGPKKEVDPKVQETFWTALNASSPMDRRKFKFIFSFNEGPRGSYDATHISEMVEGIVNKTHELHNARFGILLEIGYMRPDFEFTGLLEEPNFKYVFLKSDLTELTDKNFADMEIWLDQFQDKIVILLFNDQYDKVNRLYRYFASEERSLNVTLSDYGWDDERLWNRNLDHDHSENLRSKEGLIIIPIEPDPKEEDPSRDTSHYNTVMKKSEGNTDKNWDVLVFGGLMVCLILETWK